MCQVAAHSYFFLREIRITAGVVSPGICKGVVLYGMADLQDTSKAR